MRTLRHQSSVRSRTAVDGQSPLDVSNSAAECALRDDATAWGRSRSFEHPITENLGAIPQEWVDEVGTTLEYSLGLTES